MKTKILKEAKKIAKTKYQDFKNAYEPIEITTTDVVSGGLMGTAGAMTAQKQEAVDFTSDDNIERLKMMATVGASMVGGAVGARAFKSGFQKLSRGAVSRGQFRDTAVSELRNNLQGDFFHKVAIPFYGGGKAMQGLSALTETLMGMGRSAKRLVDPRMSYASNKSGIPQFFKNDIYTFKHMMKEAEDNINNIDMSQFKGMSKKAGIAAYKKEVAKKMKDVNKATKILHNKIINDYSNSVIFKGMPKEELRKYADDFVEQISYENLIKGIPGKPNLSKEAIDNLISVQGNLKGPVKFMQLSEKGLKQGGDVLRGIQFDHRAAKWFEKANLGETSPEKLLQNAKLIFGKNSVRKLKNGEIQIIFSPTRKGNIDWGGYAGTIVIDPKNPSHITMMADDLRDLFSIKGGEYNVLNMSPVRKIAIPDVLKKVKAPTKTADTSTKKYKPRPNVKVTDEMLDRVAKKANMAKGDIENMLELADNYTKYHKDWKLTGDFVASRLGAGAGILGVYALASED
tara:strand:+ start:1924 stop:3462 length:1539 start_codon:yes stop_codon:yes gene_type:complete